MSVQSSAKTKELSLFLRNVGIRIFFLLILMTLFFVLPIPRAYYFSTMERTIHSKLSWVWEKLSETESFDKTIVFVGSSVCFYGIDDELLSTTDTTGMSYLNFGVVHHCNDISDVILREMIERRGLKPNKVILCLKSDALARDVHHMYPLAAHTSEILETLPNGNTQFIPTVLKRIAWNTNYFTGNFKFDTGEDSLIFSGAYGFEAQTPVDSSQMEKKYNAQHTGMESVFSFLQTEARSSSPGIKNKLLAAKRSYVDNEYFQNKIFAQSAQLLDQHEIEYSILLYPNFAASRAGKEEAMVAYAQMHLSSIDFKKHPILVIKDKRLSNASSWVDMNHLSMEGAAIFSNKVRETLLNKSE